MFTPKYDYIQLIKGSKKPKGKHWKISSEYPEQYDGNVGLIPKQDLFVLDIDELDQFKEILIDLGLVWDIDIVPTVQTPSGGYHVYFQYDGRHLKTNYKIAGKTIYDTRQPKSDGYVVIPPSTTKDGDYTWLTDPEEYQFCPPELLGFLENPETGQSADPIDDLQALAAFNEDDRDLVRSKLMQVLLQNDDRNDWIKMGQFLHGVFNGADEGFDLWEKWSRSQKDSSWDDSPTRENRNRYKGFNKNGTRVNMGSFVQWVKRDSARATRAMMNKVSKTLSTYKSYDDAILHLKDLVEEKIPDFEFPCEYLELDLFVPIFKKIFQAEFESKLSVAVLKKDLANNKIIATGKKKKNGSSPMEIKSIDSVPEELLVYKVSVGSKTSYMSFSAFKFYLSSDESLIFDKVEAASSYQDTVLEYSKKHPNNDFVIGLQQKMMDEEISIAELLPKVTVYFGKKTFDPTKDSGGVIRTLGVNMTMSYNTWIDSRVEPADETITTHKFYDFLRTNLLHAEEAITVIKFMAYVYRHPEKPLQWMPLLMGSEGTGKSVIFSIIRALYGNKFITEATVDDIAGRFDMHAYRDNVLLSLEEFNMHYASKNNDAHGKLKKLLTSSSFASEEKGKNKTEEPKFFSLMGSTNNMDAIDFQSDARRFYPIRYKFKTPQAAAKAHGIDKPRTYFQKIHDIYQDEDELAIFAAYLNTVDLSDFSTSYKPDDNPSYGTMRVESRTTKEEIMETKYNQYLMDETKTFISQVGFTMQVNRDLQHQGDNDRVKTNHATHFLRDKDLEGQIQPYKGSKPYGLIFYKDPDIRMKPKEIHEVWDKYSGHNEELLYSDSFFNIEDDEDDNLQMGLFNQEPEQHDLFEKLD